MFQVFGWTPNSLEQARSEEAPATPQDHRLGGQKDRNSGILSICTAAFTSVGVLPISGDGFVVFKIDFLLLACRDCSRVDLEHAKCL